MTRRRWLLPALFVAILVPGILLGVLGVVLAIRQVLAETISIREQSRLQLETLAKQIDNEIVRLEADALQAARVARFDPSNHTHIEVTVRQLAARHPIMRHPFLLDNQSGFLFPFPVMIDSPDATQLGRQPVDRRVRALYQEAWAEEQQTGHEWAALKLYLRMRTYATVEIDRALVAQAIGRCYFKLGKLPQAVRYFQEASRRFSLSSPPAPALYLLTLDHVALCCRRLGRIPEAVDCYLTVFNRATRISPQGYGGLEIALRSRAADFLRQHLPAGEGTGSSTGPAARRVNRADDFFPTTSLFVSTARINAPINPASDADIIRIQKRTIDELRLFLSDTAEYYRKLPVERLFRLRNAAPGSAELELPVSINDFPFSVVFTPLPGSANRLFGFTPDEKYIRNLIRQHGWLPSAGGGRPVIAVIDAAGKPVGRNPGPASHLLEAWPLRHAPGKLQLGLFTSSTDYYDETARRNVTWLLGMVVILAACLMFGLVLLVRDARRESQLVAVQSDFFSQAAHTLKTPLSRIRLLAERLQLGWMDNEAEKQDGCDRIHRQVREMTAMIDVLLDCARLERCHFITGREWTDLDDIVGDVLRGWRGHLEDLGFTLDVRLDRTCPSLMLDRDAVAICLVNLITNAIHYSAEDKYLGITTRMENDEVVLEISDHGLGIDPDEQGAVLSKFYRGRRQGTNPVGGSGLGLYIVASVIEAHGGSVTLRSAPGRGTSVSLHFLVSAP